LAISLSYTTPPAGPAPAFREAFLGLQNRPVQGWEWTGQKGSRESTSAAAAAISRARAGSDVVMSTCRWTVQIPSVQKSYYCYGVTQHESKPTGVKAHQYTAGCQARQHAVRTQNRLAHVSRKAHDGEYDVTLLRHLPRV
jgi:hypothetical protein